MIEAEMVGWHHILDGHEFEQFPGTDNVQGSLAYCLSMGVTKGQTWLSYGIELKSYSQKTR